MKDEPETPDPYKTADAQFGLNKKTADYNNASSRINQSSPFGSISYTQNGTDPTTGAPIYSQSTTLSPELQSLFNSQTASQQGISDAIGGAVGRLPTGAFDASGINVDGVRDKSFASQMALLNPEFEKGARTLEGTLSDRGIPIGSEIWNDQQGEYNRAKDTSMLGASRQADLDASNEFQRQYGNAWQEYNAPYQALSTLMGNSQSVGNPQFSGVPSSQVANTDLSSGVWNAYKADAANAQQGNNQLMSGLLGIGSMAMNPASAFGYKLWG